MNRVIPYQNGLCRPLDPHTLHNVVHTRLFPEQRCSVSLRPLCLKSDSALLRSWVRRECMSLLGRQRIPYAEILQTLVRTSQSDFAQLFTCTDDSGQPLCEIQVFRAAQDDELGINSIARPGDYVMHPMPGRIMPDRYRAAILTCAEYCLMHAEVKRILVLADEENTRDNTVLNKAGFSLLTRISTPYKICNVYKYP